MKSNNPLLEVSNLKIVLDHHLIHKNVSFTVNQGESLTILGPNGAGKSVLIKAILGILPYEGTINWYQNVKIGYLPQGLTHLAIKNIPLTVCDFFSLKQTKYSHQEIVNALKLVGLEPNIIHKTAYTLSGGQFQRLLLAWVFIDQPQLVLLDEPTTGIDLGGGENIYSLLHRLQEERGLTIIMITHDVHIVYKYSDRVLCLSQKHYTCEGKPKEILTPQMLEEVFGMEIKFYQHQKVAK
jgi:zinc transport system ATP-binding protein